MKLRIAASTVAVALLALQALPTSADDKAKPKGDAPKGEMKMDDKAMAEMMANFAKFSKPGKEHANLKKMVGKWNAATKAWMSADAPPMENKGTAEFKMVLGDRFLMHDFSGEFMGQKFTGIGITGYDNFKKKYNSFWIDDMGTMMMTALGTCSDEGDCAYFGTMDEPMTNDMARTVKSTTSWKGPDTFLWTMYDFLPGGKEVKVMEITYTRVK